MIRGTNGGTVGGTVLFGHLDELLKVVGLPNTGTVNSRESVMNRMPKLVIAIVILALMAVTRSSLAITAAVENDGQDYIGRIVVVTDNRASNFAACGMLFQQYRAVIINPGGGPAIITTINIDPVFLVSPGDRFIITLQQPCDGHLLLIVEPL